MKAGEVVGIIPVLVGIAQQMVTVVVLVNVVIPTNVLPSAARNALQILIAIPRSTAVSTDISTITTYAGEAVSARHATPIATVVDQESVVTRITNVIHEEYNITVLSWSIPVLVVGLLLFAIVVGGVFVYRYFQKPSRRGTVQPVRPAERTTAIIALQETQMHSSSSAPAYNCPPPPYFNQGQGLPPQPKHFVSS